MAIAILALGVFGGAAALAAGGAVVEEISAPQTGLRAMDLLSAGQMIALRPGDRLVVSYEKSCLRETIVGGVVSIGASESIVVGGTVVRNKTECDGGKAVLNTAQAGTSAVMVFRKVSLHAD